MAKPHEGEGVWAAQSDGLAWRRWCADTLATLTFFTVVGACNELFIAKMEAGEVLRARLAGVPLLLLSGALYGMWRDAVLRRVCFDRRGPATQVVIEAVTLLSFRWPIYMTMILIGGASGSELWLGGLGAVGILLASGRPCGLWIDLVRSAFGVAPRSAC